MNYGKKGSKMSDMIWPRWPSEPPSMTDEEWWAKEAEFAAEDDARPSYDELMEQYDNEVRE